MRRGKISVKLQSLKVVRGLVVQSRDAIASPFVKKITKYA